KTTMKNLNHRMAGIAWNNLPPDFKDAIAVTRDSGCDWMCIDSLCIIQDNEKDWKEQAADMADVYPNSFLNIASTSSASSQTSYFSHR
ncbi:hypothetical protein GQ44DRAFT_596355, partial [Phaeosphaeriaceae sp. PMI808]